MYVIYDIAIVVSGAKYAALMLPFIIAVFYTLQLFYLRTSRQIRYLDIEAKSPLYTLFTDISSPNGLEHIRAFGWETYFLKESIYALDFSQSPYYYMYTVQRWLELAMDLVSLCLAFILVTMTVFFRQTTTEAGIGLSLLSLIGFGSTLNFFVSGWTRLETSLGALSRLRTFISSTPQEVGNCEDCSHVPQQWPQLGTVEFSNVSAKYQ
jgi:ABC-type multidrug transport system fused ATPase/permease subunit